MNTAPARGEVVGIQYLRGAAAIMVVLHHVRDQFPALSALIPTTALQGGVDIFFVISGFIMTYTVALKPLTPGAFIERRLARIAPLYWTMTAVTAVLAIGAPHLFRDTKFTASGLLTSLFFIPAHNAGKPEDIAPLLKLGWTLNYEMFFYFAFAAVIFLPPFRRSATLLAGFGLLIALLPLTRLSAAPLVFYSNPITLEFVFGCFVGAMCARPITLPSRLALPALIAATVALLWFGGGSTVGVYRVLNLGIAATVIVFSVASLDRTGMFATGGILARLWKTLGDASYSIYLTHLFPLILFRQVWTRIGLPVSGVAPMLSFIAISAAVTISASVAIYFFVERPITDRARSLIKAIKPRTRRLPASP